MFNANLLKETQYKSLIEQFWNEWVKRKTEFKSVTEWWEVAKKKIKTVTMEYSKSKCKENINISKLEKEVAFLKSKTRSREINDQIQMTEGQIKKFYAENRDAFILRSKVSKLIENETCSKYFFNLEKQRSKSKLWTQIRTDSVEVKHGINSIIDEQIKYFST